MWKKEKVILVTNNDRVYDKHVLLTHPQASSLKPNQTPVSEQTVFEKDDF